MAEEIEMTENTIEDSKPSFINIGEDSTVEGGTIFKVLTTPDYRWSLWVVPRPCGWAINFEKAPNWFHRLMQKLILGFRWEKLK